MENLICSAIVMQNLEGEAKAIKDYQNSLAKIEESNIEAFAESEPIFAEIIADELNHIIKLSELYAKLSGIEPKGD